MKGGMDGVRVMMGWDGIVSLLAPLSSSRRGGMGRTCPATARKQKKKRVDVRDATRSTTRLRFHLFRVQATRGVAFARVALRSFVGLFIECCHIAAIPPPSTTSQRSPPWTRHRSHCPLPPYPRSPLHQLPPREVTVRATPSHSPTSPTCPSSTPSTSPPPPEEPPR